MIYNGMGAALPMAGLGNTFYYSDYSLGGGHKDYFRDPFPCCSGTYPQSVADYHDLIYFQDSESLYVNLFVPSQVIWNRAGSEIKVEQETSYPESESTTLRIAPTASTSFNLKVRVPKWCQTAWIEINGSRQAVNCQPGDWAVIERRWQSGDLVQVHLPMRPRLVPIDKLHPNRIAFMVGPVVLVQEHEPTIVAAGPDPSKWILPTGRSLEYRVPAQPSRPFVPFYRVGSGTSYGMYFDIHA